MSFWERINVAPKLIVISESFNSVLNKLQPVFDCVNYILLNPRVVIKDAEQFTLTNNVDDDIF